MTRIIAGEAGGRRLHVPDGTGTRPTTDRVREALFSRLEHLGLLDGTAVLDLFAGSGALGLEAVSRGAASCVLVDADRRAIRAARRNAAELALPEVVVVGEPALRALDSPATAGPFDVALLDPPYDLGEEELERVLAALCRPGRPGRLAPDAVVVVERSTRAPEPRWGGGLVAADARSYGETRLWFADVAPVPAPDEPPA